MKHQELNKDDIKTIRTYADEDMSTTRTAISLGLNYTTIVRRLESIYRITKLNPKRFWELCALLKMTEEASNDS